MKSWAIPAAIIVAVEYLFALAIGARVGFRYQIPFATYMILGIAFAGIGAALIIVAKLGLYAVQREESPARRLLSELEYIWSFIIAVLLSALQISVLTWTKVMLPIASPFWADPLLASLDHALFRSDPWRLANLLFGWAAPFIDRAYISWAPVKFGTFLVLAFAPQSMRKSRAFIAYFVMMGAVAIGQYFLSSAGPVFYEQLGLGQRFSQMPIEPWVATARTYLWQDHLKAGGDIGGGISAMPSLHVAAALWIALVWRSYNRAAGAIGFVYFALILVGSVLLGWHYAFDGIAAVSITTVAWFAAARLTSARALQSSSAERAPLRPSLVNQRS
jgi:PAP2 superfamily